MATGLQMVRISLIDASEKLFTALMEVPCDYEHMARRANLGAALEQLNAARRIIEFCIVVDVESRDGMDAGVRRALETAIGERDGN